MSSQFSTPLASPALSDISSSSSFVVLPTGTLLQDTTSSSYDSDDEIVYTVSEDSDGSTESQPAFDDDFVVLSRRRSPNTTTLETGLSTPNGDGGDTTSISIGQLIEGLQNTTLSDSGPSSHVPIPTALVPPPTVGLKKKRKSKAARARASAKAAAGSYPSPISSPNRDAPIELKPKQVEDVTKRGKFSKKSKKKRTPPTTSVLSSPSGFPARSIVDDMSEGLSQDGDAESVVAPTIYEEAAGFITS